MQSALQLFALFGQHGFSEEKLSTKGNDDKLNLSTGQGKLAMIISAIIYKKYLGEPVLFVIDETLANLGIDTTNLVCNEIKKIFSDSIVLSVDHNARHNQGFYSDLIDLASFKPVEVMGIIEEVND